MYRPKGRSGRTKKQGHLGLKCDRRSYLQNYQAPETILWALVSSHLNHRAIQRWLGQLHSKNIAIALQVKQRDLGGISWN